MEKIISIEDMIISTETKKLVLGSMLHKALSDDGRFSRWMSRTIEKHNLEENKHYVLLEKEQVRDNTGKFKKGTTKEYGFLIEVAEILLSSNIKYTQDLLKFKRDIYNTINKQNKSIDDLKARVFKLEDNKQLKKLQSELKQLQKDSESENAWQQELVTLFSYTGKPLIQEVKIANPRGSFIRLDLCRPGNPTFAYELKRGIITRDMILHKVGQKDYFTVLKSKYKTPKLVFLSPLGIEADALELIENVFNKDIQYQSLGNLVKKAWKQIKDYHTFDKFVEKDISPRFKLLSKWLTY